MLFSRRQRSKPLKNCKNGLENLPNDHMHFSLFNARKLTSYCCLCLVYKRNEKKLAALSRFLAGTGRYEFENLTHQNISAMSHQLAQVSEDANKGIITSEQFYMTLLGALPIQPVDYTGALNAIKGAEYNISLLPDVQETLIDLKKTYGVRFAVVTDSMATTPQKKDWMEKAGINTDMYV